MIINDPRESNDRGDIAWFTHDVGYTVLDRGHTHLLATFGGLHLRHGPARYEFLRMLSNLPVNIVAVRDDEQCWYQRGVRGVGASLEESAAGLRKIIDDLRPDRVTVVGASAGGYGALAFGALLGADKVVSFSPQTFLTRGQRLRHADLRWRPQVRLARASATSATALDLRRWLSDRACHGEVHFASQHRLDTVHARRLETIPGLTLVPHTSNSHSLVQDLRKSGELEALLVG